MRIIPTYIHGVLDYLVGLLIICSPWLFRFNHHGVETYVPIAIGIFTIVYSLLTNYELGALGLITMRVHLAMDLAGGVILLSSPWLFGFTENVWLPHVLLGGFEIVASLISKKNVSEQTFA